MISPPSPTPQHGPIEADFAVAISLFHAYDLLGQHGLRSFHQYLSHTFTTPYSRTHTETSHHPEFSTVLQDLRRKLAGQNSCTDGLTGSGQTPPNYSTRSSHYTSPSQPTSSSSSSSSSESFFYSHPKLKKLEEVVVRHFRDWGERQPTAATGGRDAAGSSGTPLPSQTRVMIFSQYRESVQEIADMLSGHAPLVRVMSFVGHGTTGKSTSKGLTQREQTEVSSRVCVCVCVKIKLERLR